jgi:hypothetical protein
MTAMRNSLLCFKPRCLDRFTSALVGRRRFARDSKATSRARCRRPFCRRSPSRDSLAKTEQGRCDSDDWRPSNPSKTAEGERVQTAGLWGTLRNPSLSVGFRDCQAGSNSQRRAIFFSLLVVR